MYSIGEGEVFATQVATVEVRLLTVFVVPPCALALHGTRKPANIVVLVFSAESFPHLIR